MRRLVLLWALVASLLLPELGAAQGVGPGSGGQVGPGNSGGGCTTNCSFGGVTTMNSIAGLSALNGWAPQFAVRDDSSATLPVAGSAVAQGDLLTLNDGCATHAVIGAAIVSGGAITRYNVVNRGVCATIPANPVTVSSSTGSDTTPTFTLSWAPVAAATVQTPQLSQNSGNVIQTGTGNQYLASGGENVLFGYRDCLQCGYVSGVGDSTFNVIMGHNASGSGAGCTSYPIVVTATTALGTDALRNNCGSNNVVAIGTSALIAYAQQYTASQDPIVETVAVGTGSMHYWNPTANLTGGGYNTAIGGNSCIGSSTLAVSFQKVTCAGYNTGKALTTGVNQLLLSGNGNNLGASNDDTGNGVILIGSGNQVIDTPASGTGSYMNIENSLIAAIHTPTINTGFGTSVAQPTGHSSLNWTMIIGTGGTASTGTLNMTATAPTGWNCLVNDVTSPQFATRTSGSTTTTVSLANYVGSTATPWNAADVLTGSCFAY